MEIISNKLRELRIVNDLTLIQLEKKLNIPRATISRYENGMTIPTAENILKYAQYFDVSTDYLLGLADEDGYQISKIKAPSYEGALSEGEQL